MNNDSAILILLADQQRVIETLRALVAEMQQRPGGVTREGIAAELDAEADAYRDLPNVPGRPIDTESVLRLAADLVRQQAT